MSKPLLITEPTLLRLSKPLQVSESVVVSPSTEHPLKSLLITESPLLRMSKPLLITESVVVSPSTEHPRKEVVIDVISSSETATTPLEAAEPAPSPREEISVPVEIPSLIIQMPTIQTTIEERKSAVKAAYATISSSSAGVVGLINVYLSEKIGHAQKLALAACTLLFLLAFMMVVALLARPPSGSRAVKILECMTVGSLVVAILVSAFVFIGWSSLS